MQCKKSTINQRSIRGPIPIVYLVIVYAVLPFLTPAIPKPIHCLVLIPRDAIIHSTTRSIVSAILDSLSVHVVSICGICVSIRPICHLDGIRRRNIVSIRAICHVAGVYTTVRSVIVHDWRYCSVDWRMDSLGVCVCGFVFESLDQLVHNDGEPCTCKWSNPVDPVVTFEFTNDNCRSE